MPVVRIDFDDRKVKKKDILALSRAIQKIVSQATKIDDVFVYANASQIKVKIAPVEIFVQMSEQKITDVDKLVSKIKSGLSKWKKENNFHYLINFTFIPMKWKIEIGI